MLLAAVMLVGVFVAVPSGVTTRASSGSSIVLTAAKKPPANEIGITSTQIHIAMIADVNTPVQPGLFQPSVNEVKAWAAIVNKHGGLAGRKVVVDTCDSQLNPNATTNCVIRACSSDFALVATSALVMTDISDVADCKDAQGKAIGIPNLIGIAISPTETCSPMSYLVAGSDETYCATMNDHPQTYTVPVGDYRYYTSHFKGLHGIWIYNNDVGALALASVSTFTAGSNLGIKKDAQGFYTSADAAPQSALTPFVADIKQFGSTFALDGASPGNMVLFRREANLQGVNTVKVWGCNQGCYDSTFIQQGGTGLDNTYTLLNVLPFYTECHLNASLSALARQLGGGCNKLQANALAAYTSALLFQDVVQKAAVSGKTLNRQTLFTALNNEHSFTANGIIGPTNVGKHLPSPCIVMVEIIHGQWQRVYPKKAGTFDCSPANITQIKLNLSA